MQNLDFSNLSADDLLALAETQPQAPDNSTVIMARPQEVAQVLENTVTPPQAPQVVETTGRGRPRFTDPTNPQQIQAITKRCKRHYIYIAGVFVPQTKKAALELAKALKSQGNPVSARIDNEDTLVFW